MNWLWLTLLTPVWLTGSPPGTPTRLVEHEYALVGTVDDVKRKMESLSRCHADGELEWFTWQFDQGLMPLDEALRQLEIFATKVMSEFKA